MPLALRPIIVAILLILSLAAQVAADPLEDGTVAYNGGDYATALRLFQQSADQGSATAQFNVGTMYANGQGVAQNYVLAYKWFSLSAAQGYTDAVKGRDFITARMTPAEVNEAQKLVPAPANADIVISMRRVGGINVVPVLINDAITLYFVVDSGAADVSIPANVVSRLALADADFIGQRNINLLMDQQPFRKHSAFDP